MLIINHRPRGTLNWSRVAHVEQGSAALGIALKEMERGNEIQVIDSATGEQLYPVLKKEPGSEDGKRSESKTG